ncbi:unnamed protein product [Owenia fusiformis]|uniref:Uncharacterized protein n=1 Tax=Owenia fusiformis TaxID=6347 RepID=A0A8J1UMS9_OWEFU|nr:unnamed protein product [Owenia fusiformis]
MDEMNEQEFTSLDSYDNLTMTSVPVSLSTAASISVLYEIYMNVEFNVYGIVLPIVCIVGIVTNILNLLVLTRPLMRNATNKFLLGLAACDLGALTILLIYYIYFYSLGNGAKLNDDGDWLTIPFPWRLFYHVHTIPTNIFVTASNTLILGVTVFRFCAVKFPIKAKKLCTNHRAKLYIVATLIWAVILNSPEFFQKHLVCAKSENIINGTIYSTSIWKLNSTSIYYNRLFQTIYYPTKTALNILIPWLASLILTVILIHSLWANVPAKKSKNTRLRRRSDQLIQSKLTAMSKMRKNYYITWTLIAVNFCFLICEGPSAVFFMLIISLDREELYKGEYSIARVFIDMFLVMNLALNFFMYAMASRSFRQELTRLFYNSPLLRRYGSLVQNGSSFRSSRHLTSSIRSTKLVHQGSYKSQQSYHL